MKRQATKLEKIWESYILRVTEFLERNPENNSLNRLSMSSALDRSWPTEGVSLIHTKKG